MVTCKKILSGLILVAFGWVLSVHVGAGPAAAQGFLPSLLDPRSPLVCIPSLQGEVRITPMWMRVLYGKQTIPAFGISWDLRRDFFMVNPELFLDTMARVQAGRFGLRGHYEIRDFTGETSSPVGLITRNEFDFSGLRIGLDYDIYQQWNTRFGVNVDYSAYVPIFTESSQTPGGKKLLANLPVTLGLHGSYNPLRTFFGASFICDAEIRWPILGAQVTDWRISAGLKGTTTVLGSWAIKGGYRETTVNFNDRQIFNGVSVLAPLDVTMGGWLVELSYYYQ